MIEGSQVWTCGFRRRPRRQPEATRYAQLDPKLVSAAHQFEASLMAELLKPLSSDGAFGDDWIATARPVVSER